MSELRNVNYPLRLAHLQSVMLVNKHIACSGTIGLAGGGGSLSERNRILSGGFRRIRAKEEVVTRAGAEGWKAAKKLVEGPVA